jgi:hypothetical protein
MTEGHEKHEEKPRNVFFVIFVDRRAFVVSLVAAGGRG